MMAIKDAQIYEKVIKKPHQGLHPSQHGEKNFEKNGTQK